MKHASARLPASPDAQLLKVRRPRGGQTNQRFVSPDGDAVDRRSVQNAVSKLLAEQHSSVFNVQLRLELSAVRQPNIIVFWLKWGNIQESFWLFGMSATGV